MANTLSDRKRTATPPATNDALRISGAALVLSTAFWAYLVYSAPLDHIQGLIQKLSLIHI